MARKPRNEEVPMRKMLLVVGLIAVTCISAFAISEDTFHMGIDAFFNAYGSPFYGPQIAAFYDALVNGTAINMGSGTFPGTLFIIPWDETVYSFGDLGRRLQIVYFFAGVTPAELAGKVQVRWTLDWADEELTIDWVTYDWILANSDPNAGWIQPGSWIAVPEGTVGTFGNGFWGAYGFTADTPEARAALLADIVDIWNNQTFFSGQIRYRSDVTDPWSYFDPLIVEMVPQTVFGWLDAYHLDVTTAMELHHDNIEEWLDAFESMGVPLEVVFDRAAAYGVNSLRALMKIYVGEEIYGLIAEIIQKIVDDMKASGQTSINLDEVIQKYGLADLINDQRRDILVFLILRSYGIQVDTWGKILDNENPNFGEIVSFVLNGALPIDGLELAGAYLCFWQIMPDGKKNVLAGDLSFMQFAQDENGEWKLIFDTSLLPGPGQYQVFIFLRLPGVLQNFALLPITMTVGE